MILRALEIRQIHSENLVFSAISQYIHDIHIPYDLTEVIAYIQNTLRDFLFARTAAKKRKTLTFSFIKWLEVL